MYNFIPVRMPFDERIRHNYCTTIAIVMMMKNKVPEKLCSILQQELKQAQGFIPWQKRYARSTLKPSAIDLTVTMLMSKMWRVKAVRDQAEANLADAKLGARSAQVMANTHALEVAQHNLASMQAQHTLMHGVSPLSGYVLDTYFATSEWIPAFRPVLSIVDPSEYTVQFYLPVSYLSSIKLGDVLHVEVQGQYACGNGTI